MKFIEPSVTYWKQQSGLEGLWDHIARCTRVCYQSKARENESGYEFVKRVILKPALISGDLDDLPNCKFNITRLHGGMLEHGTVYLTIYVGSPVDDPDYIEKTEIINFFKKNKYSRVNKGEYISEDKIVHVKYSFDAYYITTNLRTLLENNRLELLSIMTEPAPEHFRRYTFSVITDIGVTREMNRHRVLSIAEQSTIYCDFSKGKFGTELTYIRPAWLTYDDIENPKDDNVRKYLDDLKKAEETYLDLRKGAWISERARQVLPLNTKTQAIYTGFADDFEHIIDLRYKNLSGRDHPNINVIGGMLEKELNNAIE